MIEKLKYIERQTGGEDMVLRTEKIPAQPWEMQEKINEIIELLNAIVIDVDGTKCVDGSKSPAENVQKDTETRSENVQDELDRTRKALDKAIYFLKAFIEMYDKEAPDFMDEHDVNAVLGDIIDGCEEALDQINEITKGKENAIRKTVPRQKDK